MSDSLNPCEAVGQFRPFVARFIGKPKTKLKLPAWLKNLPKRCDNARVKALRLGSTVLWAVRNPYSVVSRALTSAFLRFHGWKPVTLQTGDLGWQMKTSRGTTFRGPLPSALRQFASEIETVAIQRMKIEQETAHDSEQQKQAETSVKAAIAIARRTEEVQAETEAAKTPERNEAQERLIMLSQFFARVEFEFEQMKRNRASGGIFKFRLVTPNVREEFTGPKALRNAMAVRAHLALDHRVQAELRNLSTVVDREAEFIA